MSGSLTGRVVVITGSTRGIGRAMARAASAAGATVVVSSRTADAVEAEIAAIRATGAEASGMVCDVSREADLRALMDHAIAEHGRIDDWVNNAGVSTGMRYHCEIASDELRRIVDVNLVSVMLATRLVLPYLLERGSGTLVNVSGRGARGEPAAYTAAYAATKAGIMAFTRSVAAEHRDAPVRILTFMPGMVDTDFYGDGMPVSEGLRDVAGNVRVVLDAIGTPIDAVGPALVRALADAPRLRQGAVVSVSGGPARMRGVLALIAARLTGRLKPM